MDVAPEIAFREVESTDQLKALILQRIDGLEEVHDRLVSCRVMVENTTPGRTSGPLHRVRLDIGVPNHEVVIDRKPPDGEQARTVEQTVNEAFDTARRKLRELKKIQHGRVKTHGLPPHGRIVRLLTDDKGVRYGFILSRDGREIYFHENALVQYTFDELEIGTEVRFAEAQGDEGPQASTVAPIDPDRVGPRQADTIPFEDRPEG